MKKLEWTSLDPRIKLGIAFCAISLMFGTMVVLSGPALALYIAQRKCDKQS